MGAGGGCTKGFVFVFDLAFGDCRARAEGCVANGAGMGGGIDLGRRGPVTTQKSRQKRTKK